MSADSRIVDVDGYVHVVCGKIICFSPGLYDTENQDDVNDLLAFAGDLYVDGSLKAIYGKDTVCELTPAGRQGPRCVLSLRHIGDMPEAVQSVIREVRDADGR